MYFPQLVLYLLQKIPPQIEMTGGPKVASYTPADLSIGAVLNVFGRNVLLRDCDAFTKEYYRVTFGLGKKYTRHSPFIRIFYELSK